MLDVVRVTMNQQLQLRHSNRLFTFSAVLMALVLYLEHGPCFSNIQLNQCT